MTDDSQLQKAVLEELNWDPRVAAGHIGVTAEGGLVHLSGHVESFVEKLAAESAAGRVKGVRAVVDEIDVRLPNDWVRDNDELAAAAADRLDWDVSLPAGQVTVVVEDGWVRLLGQVDWHYQKEAAGRDVCGLVGVVGVINEIEIASAVDTTNVSDDIMHALHRSWFFDPKTITVSAEGGTVRLAGTVHSPHERQVAIATAWAHPGVSAVEDTIAIV